MAGSGPITDLHVDGVAEAALSAAASGFAVRSLTTQASPQAARTVQATENLVRNVGAEFGLLTADDAGRRLGSLSRNLANKKHRSGDLLAIHRGRRNRFVGFRFSAQGLPLPIIRTLREKAGRHGWTESDVFR